MSTRFRLNAKRFFLTFPQCETTKQAASDNLQAKWGEDIEAYAIAAEHHEPTEEDPVGGPHLHMVIHFKEKKNFLDPHCFDFITGTHGNYQVQKGRLCDVAKYLTKEDKEPLCYNLDLEAAMAKKLSKYDVIAKLVAEGKSIEEIDAEHPGFVLREKRKLEEYIEFQKSKRARLNVPDYPSWLNVNDVEIPIGMPRQHRATQYYIWGPPGIGKSSIINRLTDAGYRGFALPYNGHWEQWSDTDYDFAYADEFHGQVKITELNAFLAGDLMHLPCRYNNKMKTKNVTTLILSNLPPDQVYKNVPEVQRQALLSRLTVITSDTFLEVTLTAQQTPISSPSRSKEVSSGRIWRLCEHGVEAPTCRECWQRDYKARKDLYYEYGQQYRPENQFDTPPFSPQTPPPQ